MKRYPAMHRGILFAGLLIFALGCQMTNQVFNRPVISPSPPPGQTRAFTQAAAPGSTRNTPSPSQPAASSTPTAGPPMACQSLAGRTLIPGLFSTDSEDVEINACYQIDLDLRLGGPEYRGTERLTFTNQTGQALTEIILRLYPNAGAVFSGSLQVDALSVNGEEVRPEIFLDDRTGLRVPLESPLAPEASLEIWAAFTGRLAEGQANTGYGIFQYSPDQQVIVMAGGYPILAEWEDGEWDVGPVLTEGDAIVSRVAGYHVSIQAPLGWRVAATGSQVSASSRLDGQTLVFAASPVREFTLVASPNFSVEKTRLGEVTLVDWSLPDTTAEGRHKLNIAVDAMQVYNRVFGQYPYRELDIVSVPLQYASGVEFPGLVLIQNRLAPSGEEYTFLNNVIAHEVAHQWWYGVVGNDNLDSPWMDEGLATFSELLYTQAEFPEVFQQNLAIDVSAVSGFEASRGEAAIGQPLENFQGQSDAYAIIVYLKGALFFQELRDRLGEDTFQKSLKLYYRQNRFDQAEPEELLAAFEEACACDLSDLFLEWGAIYDSGG